MWRSYALRIGLPQTNHRQLSESRLLMEAANLFWWALGEAIGRPVSKLRSAADQPVYATIHYLEEQFPADRTLGTFGLDDRLRLFVDVRSFGTLSTESRVVFDREDRLTSADDAWWSAEPPHPAIRFGSLFATLESGKRLRPTRPANADLDQLSALASGDTMSRRIRDAQRTGRLGLIPEDWIGLDEAPVTVGYTLDPDRDTNATGLVYFASYIAMLECGERAAMSRAPADASHSPSARQLLSRRIAYVTNAEPEDQITVAAWRFRSPAHPQQLALRYRLTRAADDSLLCLSEAILALGAPHAAHAAEHAAIGQGS